MSRKGVIIQLSDERQNPDGTWKELTRWEEFQIAYWPLYSWFSLRLRPYNLGVGNCGRRWWYQKQTEQVVEIYKDMNGRRHYVTERMR